MTSRTVLIAPNSFKGSLTSVEVARALADGWRRARPDDTIVLSPLADGGEGTLEAISAAGGWTWRTVEVRDPLARPITARWLRADDGAHAVVEMAEASGLSRIGADERDPIAATSVGTADLLLAAIAAGARHITLGIGGSATTDGGRGLVEAIDAAGPALDDIDLEVACDVSNPLLGPTGAAAIFGPQKGATPDAGRDSSTRGMPPGPTSSRRGPAAASGTRPAPARPAGSASRCWRCRTGSRRSRCAQGSTS